MWFSTKMETYTYYISTQNKIYNNNPVPQMWPPTPGLQLSPSPPGLGTTGPGLVPILAGRQASHCPKIGSSQTAFVPPPPSPWIPPVQCCSSWRHYGPRGHTQESQTPPWAVGPKEGGPPFRLVYYVLLPLRWLVRFEGFTG